MVLVQLRLRLHCVVFTHVGWKPVDKNGSDMVKSKGGIESRVLAVCQGSKNIALGELVG